MLLDICVIGMLGGHGLIGVPMSAPTMVSRTVTSPPSHISLTSMAGKLYSLNLSYA